MPAPAKLTASQARKIAQAEGAYTAAKKALEDAKAEREKVRARYRDRVPAGVALIVGGFQVKRRIQSTGKRFSLGAYLKQHKLTAAMRPFVSESDHEVWEVRPGG